MALDPYTALSLVALAIGVVALAAVLRRRGLPRGEAEVLFMLFFVATAFFGSCDILMRTSEDSGTALLWLRTGMLSILFVPLLVHFTQIYPRPVKCPMDKRWFLAAVYSLGLFVSIYFFVAAETFVREFRPFPWGLHPVIRDLPSLPPLTQVAFAVVVGLLLLSIWNLLRSFRQAVTPLEKTQMVLLFLAIPVTFFIYFLFSAILPSVGVFTPLMGSANLLYSNPIIALAILRYKLFLVPVAEHSSPAPASYSLAPGHIYLAKEERPRQAFEVFKDLVTHGAHGLLMVRIHPQKVRQDLGLEKTPILWLGETSPQEGVPAVESLEELNYTVAKFARDSGNSVLLLDGLEYLIQRNDFSRVLKMVYHMKEIVAKNNGCLLLLVDPRTLDGQQMALLERETEPLPS